MTLRHTSRTVRDGYKTKQVHRATVDIMTEIQDVNDRRKSMIRQENLKESVVDCVTPLSEELQKFQYVALKKR